MAFALQLHESKGQVLIIDDDARVRTVLHHRLEREGYEVVEAENGDQAIDIMKHGDHALTIDLILCDIRMPGSSGIEVIQHFNAQFPSIPIIVLTGYPDMDLAITLLKLGVSDYLVKPVERDALVAAVNKAVSEREVFAHI